MEIEKFAQEKFEEVDKGQDPREINLGIQN